MSHLIFHCEMDLACHYALRNPNLARECASRALNAAWHAQRPDWAVKANELLGLL